MSLKELAEQGLGVDAAKDVVKAGEYLYNKGYFLEEIAREYGTTKEDLLIKIIEKFIETLELERLEGKQINRGRRRFRVRILGYNK